ncbi:hypothetical protein L1887_14683 [Cichorium endivia]|nr:hypothetical protein L1887_14683 [Cichorium endivia]
MPKDKMFVPNLRKTVPDNREPHEGVANPHGASVMAASPSFAYTGIGWHASCVSFVNLGRLRSLDDLEELDV